MTIMVLSLVALVLLIIVPVSYSRMIQAYQGEVLRLEQEKGGLMLAVEELESEILELTSREDEMARERMALVAMDQSLPSLGGEADGGGGTYSGPVDYLLQSGRVTQDDVRKAQEFKTGSKSPFGLEEILVMLDVITSAEMKAAVAAAKAEG